MLHFNRLTYYAMPELPPGWKAPLWLSLELGIFAGRLYFEYDEYSALRTYLGFGDAAETTTTIDDIVAPAETYGHEADGLGDDAAADEAETDTGARRARSFTARPLTFLQEWLAVRRKGQDFAHTPMGHVCQGKPLAASHPFFAGPGDEGAVKRTDVAGGRYRQERLGEAGDESFAFEKVVGDNDDDDDDDDVDDDVDDDDDDGVDDDDDGVDDDEDNYCLDDENELFDENELDKEGGEVGDDKGAFVDGVEYKEYV